MIYTKAFTKSLIILMESQIKELERDLITVEYSITERAIEKEITNMKNDVEFLKEQKFDD